MNTNLSNLVKCLALTITCLQPTLGSENDFFFTHLLRNLKNDILNLKPGSNKTYIINSKLLGRNDSIELDIKSRAKGTHNEEIHETHHKEETHGKISHKEDKYLIKQHVNENNSLRNRKEREELRHKIRKAMMKEFEEIQEGHNLKIRKIMKHNRHDHGRKKIRIKVLRKERTHEVTEAVEDIVDDKSEGKFIYILSTKMSDSQSLPGEHK